jgi:hypothetical protein
MRCNCNFVFPCTTSINRHFQVISFKKKFASSLIFHILYNFFIRLYGVGIFKFDTVCVYVRVCVCACMCVCVCVCVCVCARLPHFLCYVCLFRLMQIPLSFSGNNNNSEGRQIDLKSWQWFGATVQSSGEDGAIVVSVQGPDTLTYRCDGRVYRDLKPGPLECGAGVTMVDFLSSNRT